MMSLRGQCRAMIVLTLLLSGRAITLAFIHRAGGSAQGDPPAAWLMPLIGDAVIGVSALWVAYLVFAKTGLWIWTTIITWNVLGIWDSLSAFIIHLTNPWPTFFMLDIIGPVMFFAACGMHLVIIALASSTLVRRHFIEPD